MAEKLEAKIIRPVAKVRRLRLEVPDEGAKIARLGASLDEFAANVAGITIRKTQEHARSQEEKGRVAAAKAIAAGQDTLEEMVKAGIIDRGSNPFFRDGVLFMAGKARADAYNNALTVAAAKEIPADSVDPGAMDDLIENIAAEFIHSEEDPAIQAGFAERAAGFATLAKQRHAQLVANNLENMNLDQAANLFRGTALGATDGVDAEFIVPNLVMAIQAQAEQWLDNIPDPSAHDKRTMNRAITSAIASLIEDGALGEEDAIAAMKLLRGGTGPLWGSKEHSAVIQDAIDTAVGRETRRTKLQKDRELAQQQTREADAMAEMFAAAGESGVLDTSKIVAEQRSSHGRAFRTGFADAMRQLSLSYEQAEQDTYVGNEAIERDYIARIFAGENVSLEELSMRIPARELTGDQVIMLGNLVTTHRNMLTNNPLKAARFRRMDMAIKGGLTSWMGSEFGSQAYYAALPAMGAALVAWEADPTTANFTAESPEFLKFVDDTMKNLQSQYMEFDKWQDLQEVQAQVEGLNILEAYKTTVYETSPAKLKEWYAETVMMQEGHVFSSDLADFLTAQGRALDPDAPKEDYIEAIAGQLEQAGVDLTTEENQAELEELMSEIRGTDKKVTQVEPTDDDDDDDSLGDAGAFSKLTAEGKIPGGMEVFKRLFTDVIEGIPATSTRADAGKIATAQQILRDALVTRGWIPPLKPGTKPALIRQTVASN